MKMYKNVDSHIQSRIRKLFYIKKGLISRKSQIDIPKLLSPFSDDIFDLHNEMNAHMRNLKNKQ